MLDFKSDKVRNLLLAAVHSKGYREVTNKTTRRHRVFKDGSGDTVVVSAGTNFQLYYNPGISEDKGDVIRFLLNRAGIGINCGNSLKTYCRQIESELNGLGAYTFTQVSPSVDKKPFNWGYYKPFVSGFGEKIPDSILALLAYRCIPASVLLDAALQPVQQYRNGDTGYRNIFFPFRDICDNVVGGQYKYLRNGETVKMNLPDSEREKSLWHTSETGKDGLFIVEDPLDAISHHLLYRENLQYAATGGSITGNQILQIRKMASQRRLILGNDSDFSGMFANLSIIEGKPVSKQVHNNGMASFKAGDEEFSMDFSSLTDFVKARAKANNIEVVVPATNDWNEDLKQARKKPTSKLADVTKNINDHAREITQGTGICNHI